MARTIALDSPGCSRIIRVISLRASTLPGSASSCFTLCLKSFWLKGLLSRVSPPLGPVSTLGAGISPLFPGPRTPVSTGGTGRVPVLSTTVSGLPSRDGGRSSRFPVLKGASTGASAGPRLNLACSSALPRGAVSAGVSGPSRFPGVSTGSVLPRPGSRTVVGGPSPTLGAVSSPGWMPFRASTPALAC